MSIEFSIKEDTVSIKFKNKTYKINKQKLCDIIMLLDEIKGISISYSNEEILINKIKEYKLLDEVFLENVNHL